MGSETWTHMIINQVCLKYSRKPIPPYPYILLYLFVFVSTLYTKYKSVSSPFQNNANILLLKYLY